LNTEVIRMSKLVW